MMVQLVRANWANNEPNNSGPTNNEDYTLMNAFGTGDYVTDIGTMVIIVSRFHMVNEFNHNYNIAWYTPYSFGFGTMPMPKLQFLVTLSLGQYVDITVEILLGVKHSDTVRSQSQIQCVIILHPQR